MNRINSLICSFLAFSFIFLSACDGKATVAGEAEFSGKTVGALANSDEYEVAGSYESLGAVVMGFSSVDDAIFSLENKKLDYIITDEATAYSLMRENKGLKLAAACTPILELCAYFPKGSEYAEAFDEAIKALSEDGTLYNISEAFKNGVSYEPKTSELDNTLVMATAVSGFPYCERVSGELYGVDTVTAAEVARYMGMSLEIREYEYEELYDAVLEGEADFYMAAALPEAQRSDDFVFSAPYYTVRYVALGR